MIHKLTRFYLWLVILLPAVFLFFAIQYSAVTMPYWDHCELVKFIVKVYDGTFKISDLWAPHNHTRPLVYRAILLLNARLTDWDIRSEYTYMYISIFGAFAVQGYALWVVTGRKMDRLFLAFLGFFAILSFSPVGHHNHWWSMMIQLNFAHLFIVLAFAVIALKPDRWNAQLLSALFCWLATYTLTNGLIAFIVCALVAQFSQRDPLRPGKVLLYWLGNLGLALALYVPGISEDLNSVPRASLAKILHFIPIYFGAPLASLLKFRFMIHLDMPTETFWPTTIGLFLLGLVFYLVFRFNKLLFKKNPAVLLCFSYALYCLGSAFLTALGRAGWGANQANSSRYALSESFMIWGLLFLLASLLRKSLESESVSRRHLNYRKWASLLAPLVILAFSLIAARTYYTSVRVYRAAHDFNKRLTLAFMSEKPSTSLEAEIYPNAQFVTNMKEQLKRLHIGPYRGTW